MKNSLIRRITQSLAAAALCLMPLTIQADNAKADAEIYVTIEPPLKPAAPEKIEAIEFFSYACSHCYALNPLIKQWALQLPDDVVFRRVPIGERGFYHLMARGYYTLESLGALQKLDDEIFAAVHEQGRPAFNNPDNFAQWIADQGIGTQQSVLKMLGSQTVTSKVQQANRLFDEANGTGVPSIVVDGKYRVSSNSLNTFQDLLARTDQIIAMRRAERAKH